MGAGWAPRTKFRSRICLIYALSACALCGHLCVHILLTRCLSYRVVAVTGAVVDMLGSWTQTHATPPLSPSYSSAPRSGTDAVYLTPPRQASARPMEVTPPAPSVTSRKTFIASDYSTAKRALFETATSTPLRAVSLDRPLMFQAARLLWLRTCCAVAEGADVPLAHSGADPGRGSTYHCPPAVCVAVVLGDSSRRMVALGGREGMPRSLGSVHGVYVTEFLGGSLRGVVSRVIDTPGVASTINGIAVRPDGSALLVANSKGGSNGIHEFSLADASGPQLLVVGMRGSGVVQFKRPHQVWIASDGFVFVTDAENMRVQTPQRDFFGYIGVDQLSSPIGVCANAAVVVVSESSKKHCISVFRQSDGAFLRRFGCSGYRAGELQYPYGLCFTTDDRYIAVADCYNSRVSVFGLDGYFIRHIGVGELRHPRGVASSAFDELVVADTGNRRVVVFHASGKVAMTMGDGDFRGVAVRGGAIFAQDWEGKKCVVFT